jgi:ribosomal-protein-alanine N-acetyltransferase
LLYFSVRLKDFFTDTSEYLDKNFSQQKKSVHLIFSFRNYYAVMVKHTMYNAFTKVPMFEKSPLINFIRENSENKEVSALMVQEAIDYAVKEIPSFGGFILTAQEEDKMLGAIVVNKTGLNGGNPKHRVVYLSIHDDYRQVGVGSELIKKAVHFAKGDISLRVSYESDAIERYKSLGFQPKYVEMRLSAKDLTLNK